MDKKVIVKDRTFTGIAKNPSLLGFGCMRFPKLSETELAIDETVSEQMIDESIKRGVNYFDTAYPYHHGLSETFIGKVLQKYPRDRFYLANKMPGWKVKTVEDAKEIFFEQLKKCQVEYFDYYLCHALSKDNFEVYKQPGIMDFLYKMKQEGKIRHLGFSFHDTPAVLKDIIQAYDWDFVQLQINYLDWDYQDAQQQYEIVKNHGIPCIVMEPVRGGTLATLCEASRKVLKDARPDMSVASWAIRYAASLDNVMVVLSGMSNMEQTLDNINTLSDFKPVDAKDQKIIDKALRLFLENNTIPCTDCKYCLPCPEGLDIPGLFTIYNDYLLSKFAARFIHQYEQLKETRRANHCIACGACTRHCPQNIDIPAKMAAIEEKYEALKAEQDR